jgi:hypothetical protein
MAIPLLEALSATVSCWELIVATPKDFDDGYIYVILVITMG